MSTIGQGTRVTVNQAQTVGASTRKLDRSYSADLGLAPNVTGALVFTTAPPQVTLAGAFGSFQPGSNVLVERTANNNGLFYVTAVTANALTLSPPPVAESPASATIRSA